MPTPISKEIFSLPLIFWSSLLILVSALVLATGLLLNDGLLIWSRVNSIIVNAHSLSPPFGYLALLFVLK